MALFVSNNKKEFRNMLETQYLNNKYKNIKYYCWSCFHTNSSKNFNITWQSAGNQQQTCSVGTSETAREKSFNQWLAGLIDGDGCLLISKEGYPSLEITLELPNEKSLMQIKQKLGGSVKLRSGSKSVRYRLHHKEGMLNLIHRINGEIRNTIRIPQLIKLCSLLNIPYIQAQPLTINNYWTMGFFDSDGCITASLNKISPTITISIANKYKTNLDLLIPIFNGNVYFSKHGYGHHVWMIESEKDIKLFLQYHKLNPSRTQKLKRLILIKEFFALKEINAHKAIINSATYQAWNKFLNKWKDYDTVQV